MSFKENLLKKIKIDDLSRKILGSLGPVDSGRRIDKQQVRQLLEMGPYVHRVERDLDLYIQEPVSEPPFILVLDNELKIYRTTIEDVALRKSPTIKEMISIGNAIKILKDADVVVSRKEDSLKTIQEACIAQLDLSFTENDIEEIARQGIRSLENKYAEGVIESLVLLGELLHFKPAPKTMAIRHHFIMGRLAKTDHKNWFGPLAIFSKVDNRLLAIETQHDLQDKKQIEYLEQVAAGQTPPTLEGADVFTNLKDQIVKQDHPIR
jgi:hypothetical protein